MCQRPGLLSAAPLGLSSMHTIGLDIGGTSLKSICMTADGETLSRAITPLDASRLDWPNIVRDHLHELESRHGPAAHVGVAAPGIARPDGWAIWWMQGRLSELENLD